LSCVLPSIILVANPERLLIIAPIIIYLPYFSWDNHTENAPVIAPVTVAVSAVACEVIASGGKFINQKSTSMYI